MTLLKAKVSNHNDRLDRIKNELANPKNLKAINLQIDGELLKQFKMKAISENKTMTEVLMQSIVLYLKS